MESKYTKTLSEAFPINFGVQTSLKDPLRSLLNEVGIIKEKYTNEVNRMISNLNLEEFDPTSVSEIFFIDIPISYEIDDLILSIEENSGSEIVETENEFLSYKITGFDFEEVIVPSGLPPYKVYSSGTHFPDGTYPDDYYFDEDEFVYNNPDRTLHYPLAVPAIVGISNGFAWNDSEFYISASGSSDVHIYKSFGENPVTKDYSHTTQDFDTQGNDEYLNIEDGFIEVGDNLPVSISASGIGDSVKVAYIKNTPIDNIRIIDTVNLQNPDDLSSNGIVVSSDDYAVTGNKVIFSEQRSDYNPPIGTEANEYIIFNINKNNYTSLVSSISDLSNKIKLNAKVDSYLLMEKLNDYNVLKSDSTHNNILSTEDLFVEKIPYGQFTLLLNGNFKTQMIDSSSDTYISLEFDSCTFYLGFIENDIYVRIISDTGNVFEQVVENIDDIVNTFNTISLTYKHNKLIVLLNNVELASFIVKYDIELLTNITVGKGTDVSISDIIFVKHILTNSEEEYFYNILGNNNKVYNYITSIKDNFIRIDDTGTFNLSGNYIEEIISNNSAPIHLISPANNPSCPSILNAFNQKIIHVNSNDDVESLEDVNNLRGSFTNPLNMNNMDIVFVCNSEESTESDVKNLSLHFWNTYFSFEIIPKIKINNVEKMRFRLIYNSDVITEDVESSLDSLDINHISIRIEDSTVYVTWYKNNEIAMDFNFNLLSSINKNLTKFGIEGLNGDISSILIFNNNVDEFNRNVIYTYLDGLYNNNLYFKNIDYPDNISNTIGPFQPDNGFNASYIIEYRYKKYQNPLALTTQDKRFNIPLKSNIISFT